MKVHVTEEFDAYPDGQKAIRFIAGSDHVVDDGFGAMIVKKGLAVEIKDDVKPATKDTSK